MIIKTYSQVLLIIIVIMLSMSISSNSAQQLLVNSNQQSIYDFLSNLPKTSRFVAKLNEIRSMLLDESAIKLLSGTLSLNNGQNEINNGLTVFIPNDDAFNLLDASYLNNIKNIRNDMYNLIIREKYTLDRLRTLSGSNLTSTFGNNPRLFIKCVNNFYTRQMNPSTFPFMNSSNLNPNTSSIFNQYSYLYQQQQQQQQVGVVPNTISTSLPMDELFLINNAIILEQYECTNGIVYIINTMPRYYDQSLWNLITTDASLRQTLDKWRSITVALQADVIKNALNSYATNTYFLPSDVAFNQFNNQSLLSNVTFLYDILLKSHTIKDRILFDYYFDKQQQQTTNGATREEYKTETGLIVYTEHRINNRSNSQMTMNSDEDILISIGHVKGRILPNLRNIYCASGILHVIDTVLAIPSINAYTQLSAQLELTSFKRLVDKSQKFTMLMQSMPNSIQLPTASPFNQRYGGESRQSFFLDSSSSLQFQYLTILAPHETALFSVFDYLNTNQTALELFLAQHIIVTSNALVNGFYTDHDANIFQNRVQYTTLLQGGSLMAQVELDETNGVSNRVSFYVESNPSLKTRILYGNNRVSNGVVHVVDRVLVSHVQQDINFLLDKLQSSQASLGATASYTQFLSLLQSTNMLNELKTTNRQFTLFIPSNDALARFQSLLNTNDNNIKKQVINRHLCFSTIRTNNLGQSMQQQQQMNQQQTLVCQNLLREDLVVTRNTTHFRVNLMGVASSNVVDEINSELSTLIMLERPILNALVPIYGLDNFNSNNISLLKINLFLLFNSLIFLTFL